MEKKKEKNRFPHAGSRRGELLTWAQEIVEEAFQKDPEYMEQSARAIFGATEWFWTGASTTDEKVHAICRAAMLVRLQS
jgi:hypothetical protein